MKNVFKILEREKNEFRIKAENCENDLDMYKKTFDALSYFFLLINIILI